MEKPDNKKKQAQESSTPVGDCTISIKDISTEEIEKLVSEELGFLQSKLADEERRREVIEGKTGQLLGQVSIVISVVALFIPLISDQLSDLPLWERVICISLFLVIVVAFLVSIWIASTTWIIHKYGYLRPDLEDIYECGKPETRIAFIQRYSVLLSKVIPQHIEVNNGKGTKLIRAGSAFRIGTVLLGFLIVSLSIALAINKGKPKEVSIHGSVMVIDSTKFKVLQFPRKKNDSLVLIK